MVSRRVFLKNGAFAFVSLGFAPSFLARTAFAAGAGRSKQLIAIFQRGAVDGLSVVVPFGEADYYRARPSIAIPRPDAATTRRDRSRRLLRLQPAAAAAQAALGRRASSRSSTPADRPTARGRISTRRTTWKPATPGVKSTADGWLNRYLQARHAEAGDAVPRRRA